MRLIDIDKIERRVVICGAKKCGNCELWKTLEEFEKAPTVEAEPIRHGHWKIIDQDVMGCKKYRCELCGAVIEAYNLDKIRYCGGCGAKMDEADEVTDND